MRFGSVCSGIEAASVAWNPLGWEAAWLSEIEPFPSAVLAQHYPGVPNLGDMTTLPGRIRSGEVEAPDLFCGGTPCQAFSVAGLRRSLDDARGNLSLTFCEIADAIDHVRGMRGQQPAIIFWENVPGVLSTKDNAFGCFLGALAGEDCELKPPGKRWADAGCVFGPQRAIAWRVLDAQYFGLAQRRRRVFVVASARDGFDPATVLFEFDGVRRDTAPRREAGEGAAARAGAGAAVGSGVVGSLACNTGPNGHDAGNFACNQAVDAGHVLPVITMAHGQGGAEIGFDRGPTLTCNHEAPIEAYGIRTANTSSNGWGIQEEATHTLDQAMGIAVAHTLRGEGFDASEDGTGRGTSLGPVGVTIHGTDPTVQKVASYDELAQCLRARTPGNIDNSSTTVVQQPVAFAQNSRNEVRLEGGDGQRCGALSTGGGKPGQGVPMIAFPANLSGTQCASEDGTGRGTPLVPIAFQAGNLVRGAGSQPSADVFPTLKADHGRGLSDQHPCVAFHPTQDPISSSDGSTHALGCGSTGGQASVAVAVALRGREGGATAELGDEVQNCLRASSGGGDKPHVLAPAVRDISQTLTSNYGKQVDSSDTALGPNVVFPAMQVRRLTPTEAERLMGFPDGYTAIPWRGKPADQCPDGPRYKALGNSWAVPVVRWIGERINAAVEQIKHERKAL